MFYSYPDLRVLFENLLEEEIEDLPEAVNPIDHLPNEAIETVWNLDHQPASLDILAMEQLSADYLVDFFYHEFQFSCDPLGFAQYAPEQVTHYYTPLFISTPKQFYELVVNTFHADPRKADVQQY